MDVSDPRFPEILAELQKAVGNRFIYLGLMTGLLSWLRNFGVEEVYTKFAAESLFVDDIISNTREFIDYVVGTKFNLTIGFENV